MKNHVFAMAAAAALCTSPVLAASPNRVETIGGFGLTELGFVSFFAADNFGEFSFVQFEIQGEEFTFCSAEIRPQANVVKISGKTGTADYTAVIDEMDCVGPVPTSVSATCSDNGLFNLHTNGVSKGSINGEKFSFHGNTQFTSVDCTLTFDGVDVLADGDMSIGIQKESP